MCNLGGRNLNTGVDAVMSSERKCPACGRPLTADAPEIAIYALIMLAALLRVLMPLLAPSLYVSGLVASAAAWSAAFLIYLWQYTPWLVSARPDGKDG